MSGVVVRPVDFEKPVESHAVVELLDMYAREELHGAKGLEAEVKARLPEALAAEPGTIAFLAWQDERPVGVALCFRRYSTFAGAPLVNIHDLAVRPELRGEGIGRKLLEAAEAHAKDTGCCRLTLEVLESNERARGLYRSFGFDDFPDGENGRRTFFLSKALRG